MATVHGMSTPSWRTRTASGAEVEQRELVACPVHLDDQIGVTVPAPESVTDAHGLAALRRPFRRGQQLGDQRPEPGGRMATDQVVGAPARHRYRDRGGQVHHGRGRGRRVEQVRVVVEEVGARLTREEVGIAQQGGEEVAVGRDAVHLGGVERRGQPCGRLRPGVAAGDDLGEHRVVERRDLTGCRDAVLEPQPGPGWVRVAVQGAGRGQVVPRRVLGVEPHLDGVPAGHDVRLFDAE